MYEVLFQVMPPEIISRDVPMAEHTTFRIGGPADVLVSPRSLEQLRTAICLCRENHFSLLILGSGSNLLVADRGIRGVTVRIGPELSQVRIEGETVWAQAGIGLGELARQAASSQLTGLEFAEGIPGTLGGAIVMNAGAYGGEMRQIVESVEAFSPSGQERTFQADELEYGYRHSIFQTNGYVVTSACLSLHRGEAAKIWQRIHEYSESRASKQPLEYPSAGSVFRRPAGFFVGPLLEQLGLKGYRIGGAEISNKHAGFIVNTGKATARDVLALVEHARKTAWETMGVDLQPEIRIVGDI
jgi:UDP-N-acetylmuramate dehydrogenase